MRRKKLLWIITGLIALVLILFFLLANPITEFAAHQLIKMVRSQGIRTNIGTLKTYFPGVHAEDVDVWFGPFNVTFDRLSVSPSFASLFSGTVGVQADGNAYNGEISANGDIGFDSVKASSNIKNIHLELHPQIAGFGVTSSVAELNLKEIFVLKGILERAKGALHVAQINIPTIPTFGFPIKLPPLSAGDLSGDFNFDEQIKINNIAFTSSIGSLEGNFEMTRPDKNPERPGASGLFKVKISDTLFASTPDIGSYLVLISNGKLTANTREFSLKLVGKPCRGAYTPIKFAGLCTELNFSPLP